jgi:phage head maturation protease
MTTTMLRLLAVPFGSAALVRDAGPDGKPLLFREVFTRESFGELPDRVPLQRMHLRSEPIGWAAPRLTDAGIEATGQLVDTQRARDSLVEVRAELMNGVSVGFVADPGRDEWSLPVRPRTLPQVHRRGAELVELSLVPRGAYAEATVLGVFEREAAAHAASEAIMAPFRARAAAEEGERRQRDLELLEWVDQLVEQRNTELSTPIPPAPGGLVSGITVRGQTGEFHVEGTDDYDQAVWQADAFEQERGRMLSVAVYAGVPVDPSRLDALAARCRVRPL